MKLYKTMVHVPSPTTPTIKTTVWAQVYAMSPIDAKSLLEAQYGRGNVIGTPTQVK